MPSTATRSSTSSSTAAATTKQQLQLQRQLQEQKRSRARARQYANSPIEQQYHQQQRVQQHHQQQQLQPRKEVPRRSWAMTCGVLLVLLIVAGAGGILVWKFLPTKTKSDIQEIVNATVTGDGSDKGSSSGGNGGGSGNQQPENGTDLNNSNNNSTGSSGSGFTPNNDWKFMQCQDPNTNCCNGLDLDGYCDLRLNEPMYGLVHNAMASFEDRFFLLYNQNYNLESALAYGYRALELDVARCGDQQEIVFYHGECALGTRQPLEVLENVHSFLQENPSEIVMLFLQMDGQSVSLNDFYQIMANVDDGNLVASLYSHPLDATEWPTLREMIQANQRLVLFYWNQNDCAPGAGGPGCPPGFHYYYRYGVQTEWDFSRIADIQDDPTSSCALSYAPNYQHGMQFFRVNAFLRIPSSSAAQDVLNQQSFMQERLDDCSMQNPVNGSDTKTEPFELRPNFYAVDFWEKGSVLEFIQDYNIQLMQDKQWEAANLLGSDDDSVPQEGDVGATDLDALLSGGGDGGRRRQRLRGLFGQHE